MAGAVDVVQVAEIGKSNGVIDAGLLVIGESEWWEREGPVPAYHDNAVINRNWFPQNFLFGAGCSAYQVEGAAKEGGRGISVWDDFALGQPWRIDDGSNGNVAADMYHRYKEDIKMMKQMGFNSFRFSISWPRILPAGRVSGGVNREGIDHYNDIINTLIEYAQSSDVYAVARNLLLAHAEAVQLYRTKFQEAQKGEIGIVLVTSLFLSFDENSDADKKACERARDFLLGWFLEPVMNGDYPASMIDMVSPDNLTSFSKKEKEMLAGSLDFLGMNYYSYQYIQDDPHLIGDGYLSDGKFQYKYGHDINGHTLPFSVPRGIYELLIYLNKYPTLKALYIAENGYHTATNFKLTAKMVCEDDEARIKYHQDHLANMLKAMKEVHYEVKGYFVWAWCDTYEFSSGYTMRFGLMYVDFANNCARYPKNSAAWFARFLHSESPPPHYFKPSWIQATPLLGKRASEDDVGITLTKGSKLVLGYV